MSATLARLHGQWGDLIEVAAILLVTLLLTLVISLAMRFWRRRHAESQAGNLLLGAAVDAIGAPLQAMIWILGLSAMAGRLSSGKYLSWLAPAMEPARSIAVIVVIAWFLMRVVPGATRRLVARGSTTGLRFDATVADAIDKILIATIALGASLAVFKVLGLSLASMLTFGGVAGIAIGFAAQGLVANLLGGITIYASRPFGVGDHIIFPGTDLRGVVDEIGWRATRVMGWDGRPFYVPNAKFNTETIINHSRLTFRRIAETIRVRLQDADKVRAIVDDVQAMLADHPEMKHERAFCVFDLNAVGEHALELYLFAYCKSTEYADFMAAKQDILLRIIAIVEGHGARLAVPVRYIRGSEGWGASASASTPGAR